MIFYKLYVRLKYDVRFGKGAWIWYRGNKFGGSNFIGYNSRFVSSEIGLSSYISHDSRIIKTKIGKFCSIGDGVKTHLGQHPANTFVSTHPAFFSSSVGLIPKFVNRQKFEEHKYTDSTNRYVVEIGNDVWIGCNVVISDGVKIGDGAIIASGSIVNKDVPNFAIVGGIPAKIIKYRFTEEQINFLNEYKWWEKPVEFLKDNADLFENIDRFIKESRT